MSLQLHTSNSKYTYKILHGNTTDVTWETIVKYGPDLFVVTELIEGFEPDEFSTNVKNLTRKEFDENFKIQVGSPMQYLSQETYDEFIKND